MNISQDNSNNNNLKVGLIATMPRSGTWYNHYFFYFYDGILNGHTEFSFELPKDKVGVIRNIDLDAFLICHSVCLGFYKYHGQYREVWDKLNFYVDGYNWAKNIIDSNIRHFDPSLNADVKIVYLYRNPLDQAVSFFRHAQKHKDQRHMQYKDRFGNTCAIKTLQEFIFNIGLESYIKQFLTFKVMKDIYSHNILTVKYEELVRKPEQIFKKILNHFGHNIDNEMKASAFQTALKLSRMDSMKKIEDKIGHSLGDDQADTNEKHVRDGKIGKWKTHFNNEDIARIEKRLNNFDLSLAQFDIE
ncbi:MAG: sulfotransferase domain-containing protein [Deltaproteobacteria bacterium]|nr:sulfotransferase domain-containing protein [Deltaproteobacteria bacterium]